LPVLKKPVDCFVVCWIQLYGSHAMTSQRHREVPTTSGVFLPPSPPESLPCSPRRRGSAQRRPATQSSVDVSTSAAADSDDVDVPLTPVTRRPRLTHPGCTTIKYNRRTNPELERRRTHFCHFAGTCRIVYTCGVTVLVKSSLCRQHSATVFNINL